MRKSIALIQADIIFKALYYTARNEGAEIKEELTKIYEVLAEQNPNETHVTDILDVMEYLSEFIKNGNEYRSYFIKDECDDLEDEN